ncbi:MAG: hypothetical protein HYW26_02965 [Candidatus Aenigmarchaeota archaeon]|nr:hypothetical protein [Candidatus Aenigmarchaeota archaeon]
MKEDIDKKKRDGWYDVVFLIEALGAKEEILTKTLKEHVEKLSKTPDTIIYETNYSDVQQVEKPIEGLETGYSQFVEVKFVTKTLFLLLNAVILYGPSAVEILGPERKEIRIDEVQNIVNILAGVLHQFAASGMGGIVITPKDVNK